MKFLKLLSGVGIIWSITSVALSQAGNIGFLINRFNGPGWIDDLYSVLSVPSSDSTLFIFVLSFGLFGYVVHMEKKKASRSAPFPSTVDFKVDWVEKKRLPEKASIISKVSQQRFDEEWESLEEGDREIAREIVLQGGLLETDIVALLVVRGLLPYAGAYEPIGDRVSFIQCDYAGHHSISPEFLPLLENKISEENKDYSFSS